MFSKPLKKEERDLIEIEVNKERDKLQSLIFELEKKKEDYKKKSTDKDYISFLSIKCQSLRYILEYSISSKTCLEAYREAQKKFRIKPYGFTEAVSVLNLFTEGDLGYHHYDYYSEQSTYPIYHLLQAYKREEEKNNSIELEVRLRR